MSLSLRDELSTDLAVDLLASDRLVLNWGRTELFSYCWTYACRTNLRYGESISWSSNGERGS